MTGERKLDRGGEDAQLRVLGVVDEDGLAEAQVGGDRLARVGRDLRPVEEHAERVAVLATGVAEHPQYMQPCHGPAG